MDGKLAALANFSATLDADMPLSWSHGAAFGAAAAADAVVDDAAAFGTPAAASADRGDASAAGAAGAGKQPRGVSPTDTVAALAAATAAAQTPGDALQRRLARKRHLAAAVEADAALTAARSLWPAGGSVPTPAALGTTAAKEPASARSVMQPTDQRQAASEPVLSPPAPAAEVAIAAARHETVSQQAKRGIGLWRRMMSGLGVVGQ